MAMTNIELYEALKTDVSEEAARMIAEAVPTASDIATKTFVDERFTSFEEMMDRRFERFAQEMDRRFERAAQEMDRRFEDVDRRFERLEQRFDRAFRLAIVFIGPIWAGGIAAIVRTLFFG